jgi:hypothetical protein
MSDVLTPKGVPTPVDAPAAVDERKATAAQLGRRLMRILAPTRVRSLSLHDDAGELLWINAGELDARTRRLLQDALDAFALDGALEHIERDFENARALIFCSRPGQDERATLAFAVVGGRRRPDINPEALRERVLTTMRRFGPMAPLPRGLTAVATAPQGAMQAPARELAQAHTHSPAQTHPAADMGADTEDAASVGEDDTTAVFASPTQPGEPGDACAEEFASVEVAPLRTRLYTRLRLGGTTRRYEVADSGSGTLEQDLERARRLVALVKRRGIRNTPSPASFTLPLCVASITSPDFLDRLAPALEQAGISEDAMGFCVPAEAWQQDFDATERFIARCAALRCFVALDDFNLTRAGFALVRGSALRCLKIDAALTASALEDKFAHANVAAITKAARVLGLYCVAKSVKTPEEARWLASAGVEFADRISRAGKGAATTRSARALKIADAP